MSNEYDTAVREIEQERHAICEINGIFAMLGVISWASSSDFVLAALVLILVLNFHFLFKQPRLSEPVAKSIRFERYAISVVNGIFAMLGIVSWYGSSWLALVSLIFLLVLNLSFPLKHRRRLSDAKRKQIEYRLDSLCQQRPRPTYTWPEFP